MNAEHEPKQSPEPAAPDEEEQREAQSEDPTSPERGFEDVEQDHSEQEES
jgi:hypothetical protein